MNYQTKQEAKYDSLNFYIHPRCFIVQADLDTFMYPYDKAEKMVKDLTVLLEKETLDHLLSYAEDNSNVKFIRDDESQNQLSLF